MLLCVDGDFILTAVAMRNEVIVAAHHGKIFSLVFLELDGDNVSMVTTGPEGRTVS